MFGSQAKAEAKGARGSMAPTGPVTQTSSRPDRGEGSTRRQAKTLVAKGVNLYYGDFHAVENVDMTIEPNKVTALIGSSGCGKTTFLRILLGMEQPTRGSILLDGEPLPPEPGSLGELNESLMKRLRIYARLRQAEGLHRIAINIDHLGVGEGRELIGRHRPSFALRRQP